MGKFPHVPIGEDQDDNNPRRFSTGVRPLIGTGHPSIPVSVVSLPGREDRDSLIGSWRREKLHQVESTPDQLDIFMTGLVEDNYTDLRNRLTKLQPVLLDPEKQVKLRDILLELLDFIERGDNHFIAPEIRELKSRIRGHLECLLPVAEL